MKAKLYKLCKAPDTWQALNKYQILLGSKMSSVVNVPCFNYSFREKKVTIMLHICISWDAG